MTQTCQYFSNQMIMWQFLKEWKRKKIQGKGNEYKQSVSMQTITNLNLDIKERLHATKNEKS